MPSGFAAAASPPRSTRKPRSRCLYAGPGRRRARPPRSWRSAFPAAGRAGRSCRRSAGPGQVGHRRAVPAGVDVLGSGHGHELVNDQPAPVGRQIQAADQRVGADPTHQIRERVGTCSPVDSWTGSSRGPATDWPVRTSTPRRRRTRAAVLDKRGSSRAAAAEPCPAAATGTAGQPGRAASWPAGSSAAGPGRRPRCRYSPRRRRRRCSAPALGGGRHGGQLKLSGDVVAQVDRLGEAAEPVRAFGHARDRQQLVHAARGQDQPVIARPGPSRLPGRPS